MTAHLKPTARTARRQQTHERILGAATAEFVRSGVEGADIGAIAAAAGVAHGTFYFHFPSREHVLLELSQREEARLTGELRAVLDRAPGVPEMLTEVVRQLEAVERRFGAVLFKDLLALHLASAQQHLDGWAEHPLIVALVTELDRARAAGRVHPDVNAFDSALFFLFGIYGALCATPDSPDRDDMTRRLVATVARGLDNPVPHHQEV